MHRQTLCVRMRARLVRAPDMSAISDIEALLRSSEPYSADLASERRQVERRRVLLAKGIAKTLQNLARSTNFAEVEAAVERYKEANACPVEAKAAVRPWSRPPRIFITLNT